MALKYPLSQSSRESLILSLFWSCHQKLQEPPQLTSTVLLLEINIFKLIQTQGCSDKQQKMQSKTGRFWGEKSSTAVIFYVILYYANRHKG